MERVEEEFHPLLDFIFFFFFGPLLPCCDVGISFQSLRLSLDLWLCMPEGSRRVAQSTEALCKNGLGLGRDITPLTQSARRTLFLFLPVCSCGTSVQEHTVSLPRRKVQTLFFNVTIYLTGQEESNFRILPKL